MLATRPLDPIVGLPRASIRPSPAQRSGSTRTCGACLFFAQALGKALIAADLANERAAFGALTRCDVIE